MCGVQVYRKIRTEIYGESNVPQVKDIREMGHRDTGESNVLLHRSPGQSCADILVLRTLLSTI